MWITNGKDSNSFCCVGASLTLGNMGATSLQKHMGYHRHKALVKAHKTQSQLKFHANNEQKASTYFSSSIKQKYWYQVLLYQLQFMKQRYC